MSDIERLSALDGYIAMSLVDSSSGLVIESNVQGTFDIEAASAANTEVVQAKLRAMRDIGLEDDYIEDILISLGTQYHLIRPLAAHPDVFIYLALDRSKANLAKARIVLKAFENTVKF